MTAEPALNGGSVQTPKQKRIGWIIAIGVAFVALSIGLNLYTTFSTHNLVQQVRTEQQQNTERVADAAKTEHLIILLQQLNNKHHDQTNMELLAICRALPGCSIVNDP